MENDDGYVGTNTRGSNRRCLAQSPKSDICARVVETIARNGKDTAPVAVNGTR